MKSDTTVKALVYAQHGLPEYWVVAIPTRQLIVHRQPTMDGYADVQTYNEDAVVCISACPSRTLSVRVADLLP